MDGVYTPTDNHTPYYRISAHISRVFNFTNFTNSELFVKFIQLKFESCAVHTHEQQELAKFFQRFFFKTAIRENLDPQNIRYYYLVLFHLGNNIGLV